MRHEKPLTLLLDWHNARTRLIEPQQGELFRELLRRLERFEIFEYERIKADPGNAHENCVECDVGGSD